MMRVLMQPRGDNLLIAAEEAMRLADQDPASGLPVAERAARRAHRGHHLVAGSVAERAWGHALLHCGDLGAAIRHLRRSLGCAEQAGSSELAAEARLKLAFAVLQRGRPQAALAEIDAALRHLDGASAGRGHAQRAIILHVIGRLDESLAGYEVALAVLRERDDRLGAQRLLINRALVHADRHAFGAAERDLLEAEELARRLGRDLTIGLVANNLGLMETLRGDVPAALAHLDRAEQIIGAHGAQLGTLHQDRTELLLSVGLLAEAQAAARSAVEAYRRERRLLKVPEARLLLSRVAFLAGDDVLAEAEARRAGRAFTRQQRPGWVALARLATLRAQLAGGRTARVPAAQGRELVERLGTAGWPSAAIEARLIAAELAGPSNSAEAQALLAEAARARGRSGPAGLRARGWYAQARRRRSAGDARGALAAVRAGLRLLADDSATWAAADLRVHAALHRAELSGLGLRIALESLRPERVLEWAERGRAGQIRPRSVFPPDDPELAGLLADLRAVTLEINRLGDGGPQSPSGPGRSRLTRRQTGLEQAVRDRARRARGTEDAAGRVPGPLSPADVVSRADLAQSLRDWALVELVELDGELSALTVVAGRVRQHRLGPLSRAAGLTERLPFALQRLARLDGPEPARAAAADLLRGTAQRLDDLLLRPLAELGDRPLVVVPTGPLHSLPWSLLPSCRGRPLTVAASATLWHLTTIRPAVAFGPPVVVAGPDLPGADGEARAVARLHRTRPVTGPAATAEAVLAALGQAGVVHLAAHGRLRADNPLFSEVLLADGPLVLYDLERLARAPHTVVLAACESGRSVVRTGDELLGLSATFLARGTAQLVASVIPVPDAETAPLMVDFHRRLVAGQAPADALAEAQQGLAGADPRALAASAGFVCLGSGVSAVPGAR